MRAGYRDAADFLLARVAEDEEVALSWPADPGPPPAPHTFWVDPQGHVLYQPRARVLAECEAKRLIVGWFQKLATMTDRDSLEIRHNELLHVLGALALPYADHPDFDESWRP